MEAETMPRCGACMILVHIQWQVQKQPALVNPSSKTEANNKGIKYLGNSKDQCGLP